MDYSKMDSSKNAKISIFGKIFEKFPKFYKIFLNFCIPRQERATYFSNFNFRKNVIIQQPLSKIWLCTSHSSLCKTTVSLSARSKHLERLTSASPFQTPFYAAMRPYFSCFDCAWRRLGKFALGLTHVSSRNRNACAK